MKKQVVFIHGGDAFTKHEDFLRHLEQVPLRNVPGSEQSSHWVKTLQDALGEDYEVFMPTMPNKQNARYQEWALWFRRHLPFLRDGVVLVGWSLGGMFLAKFLSEHEIPVSVSSLYLLAAPCGICDDEEGNDCGDFQFDPAILNNLTNQVKKCEIWHSEDDFVVPFSHATTYKLALPQATVVTFTDKNHFLVPELPELIKSITK
jgi:predicted alpha/beta hydrolase family esterase